MGRRRKSPLPADPIEAEIEGLSHDGRGVTHIEGKAVFISGALPGEQVSFRYQRRQRRHDEGRVEAVLQASPDRVSPRCEAFGICGGCSLQHQRPAAQIRDKQQILADAFERIGKVTPDRWLAPLIPASHWGYRGKARLGVKHVLKKGKVLVGFREQSSAFVAEMRDCPILDPRVGQSLEALAHLVAGLSQPNRLPQIEVAVGDQGVVLAFRILEALTDTDRRQLLSFGRERDFIIAIQPGGPETLYSLDETQSLMQCYRLPDFDLSLAFLPNDFTQVNQDINRQMVKQAIDLLTVGPTDEVLDLFCGLGNFTLPLATRAKQVTGVEGDAALVARARQNAELNALNNARFFTANLYAELGAEPWLNSIYPKALIDPPRSGAQEVLPLIPKLGVERLVYVSCYPSTLARDAGILVQKHGYRLLQAGVMDMFPHTAHVESISLFEKNL